MYQLPLAVRPDGATEPGEPTIRAMLIELTQQIARLNANYQTVRAEAIEMVKDEIERELREDPDLRQEVLDALVDDSDLREEALEALRDDEDLKEEIRDEFRTTVEDAIRDAL